MGSYDSRALFLAGEQKMGITSCMFLVPTLIAVDFKGNLAPIPYAFPVLEKMENGPEVKKVSRAPKQFPPELYSRKKSE